MEQKLEIEDIMHGLSETNVVSDDKVFENMPVFPRISRSKELTLLLVNRLKNFKLDNNTVTCNTEAIYVDEKYTYRYFDYRHVFVPKDNVSSIAVQISFINEKTIRIQMQEGFTVTDNKTEMIKDMITEKVDLKISETEETLIITNGTLAVKIEKNPWNLEIEDANGKVFYKQFGRDNHSFMPYEICPMGFLFDRKDGEQYACEAVCSDPYENFYGLGENFTGHNRKGRAFDLWNTNSLGVNTERGYKYIPFYLSSNGYGVYYNTSRKLRCDMSATLSKANSILVEGSVLDMFIMQGDNMKEIIPLYYNLTGKPVLPPKWSFGLWISKISYGTRNEVETVAKKMRDYDIPCDVIHIDTDWFAENWICDWKFDETKFPKVEEMIDHLHKDGYKLSLWQLPYIERGQISYEIYDEGVKNGYFATCPDGDMKFAHGLIDLTNPEAVTWYKEKLIKPLLRKGIDVIKVDFGESAPPFFKYAGKDGKEMHNLYALLYNKVIYEATKEELGEENALIWARSAWAGSQQYPVHWGGDSGTDFGSMASSLKGCLNASVSGIPFWSSDIGGFFFDCNPTLYIRWSQWGMFCSHARLHGFYTREPWDFGEEAVAIFRKYVKLRYQLIPYIYNYSIAACKTYEMIHRSMIYEYPDDINAKNLDSQYMFGKDILVAPILNEKGDFQVYLPEGKWTDYHTNAIIDGAKWIQDTAPLDIMPIYIRENAIIPMGPSMNYIDEFEIEEYQVHLYPGVGSNEFQFYDEDSTISMIASNENIHILAVQRNHAYQFIVHNKKVKSAMVNGQDYKISVEKDDTVIRIEKGNNTNSISLTLI